MFVDVADVLAVPPDTVSLPPPLPITGC